MTILTFGETPKTPNDYVREIQELLGARCPVTAHFYNGVLVRIEVEPTYREGGTVTVERVDEETGDTIYEYDDSGLIEQKLSQAQIKKLETWVAENIKG